MDADKGLSLTAAITRSPGQWADEEGSRSAVGTYWPGFGYLDRLVEGRMMRLINNALVCLLLASGNWGERDFGRLRKDRSGYAAF